MWLRQSIPVALGLAALVSASLLLWPDRPPRQSTTSGHRSPATQPDSSPRTTIVQPEPKSAAETAPAQPNPPEPIDMPLDLTLDDDVLTAVNYRDAPKGALLPPPPLDWTAQASEPAHPWIAEDVDLFNTEQGVRGFSRGHWISETVRLRGGIGYLRPAEFEEFEEHQLAIGLGIDLAF